MAPITLITAEIEAIYEFDFVKCPVSRLLEEGSRLWWAKRIGGSIVAYVALELGATALLHVLLDAWDILEGPGDQLFLDSFPGLYGIIR